MYQLFGKRALDYLCAVMGMILFSPIFIVVAILVRIKLGSPVVFKQYRPGQNGEIFTLYKFRTMTDERDSSGKFLADEVRLTSFGKRLRSTSLDELPELWNIIKGDMSIVGPRPLLVRDAVFFSKEQNKRQDVKPGLTGLAQVNGRNCVSWEDRFHYDIEYIDKFSFTQDFRIVLKTVRVVIRKEGINAEGFAVAEDLGDYLLRKGSIGIKEYKVGMMKAQSLIKGHETTNG